MVLRTKIEFFFASCFCVIFQLFEIIVCGGYCFQLMCPVDIDECALGRCDNVTHSASCTNLDGSYLCVCDKGYVNNNNSCVGESPCTT